MARPSQTDLAVLAALSIGPMTGYALRETITTELGSFWSESFGQIYRHWPGCVPPDSSGPILGRAATRRFTG